MASGGLSLQEEDAPPGPTRRPAHRATPSRRRDRLEQAWRVSALLLGLQLLGLAALSVRLFDHYHLGLDFSTAYQAWWLVAHGHLDPFSSTSSVPFLRLHFELYPWVLAPLYWVDRSPVVLLWVQDIALVGAELVIVRWSLDVFRRHDIGGSGTGGHDAMGHDAVRWPAVAGLAGVTLLLLANPFLYATAFDDFHSEAIAVLFAVLAARDLHKGRNRRFFVWAGALLLFGDVAAIYLIGIGLSALVVSKTSRWVGGIAAVAGLAWLELISILGDDVGSGIGPRYGYLTSGVAPGHRVTILRVVQGVVEHPSRPAGVLHHQLPFILDVVRPGGVLGVLSPWVIFVALLTLVPNALIPGTFFIQVGFQNLAGSLFAIVGSFLIVEWILRAEWFHRKPASSVATKAVAVALSLAIVGSSLVYGLPRLHQTYQGRLTVSPATASLLATAAPRIPPDADVLASAIVMGRFGDRPHLSTVWTDTATYTVVRGVPLVFVLVLPPANPDPTIDPEASAAAITADIAGLLREPGARVLGRGAGGAVIEWTPPAGIATLTLPLPSALESNRAPSLRSGTS